MDVPVEAATYHAPDCSALVLRFVLYVLFLMAAHSMSLVLFTHQVLDTLHYAAIGVWLLARCKGLRGPLGEGGCIGALVQALRRWYELNPQDR